MSEESKEAVTPVDAVIKPVEEVVEEVVESNDDIFITEEDRFTITVEYYLKEKDPIIKDFSEDFSDSEKGIKKIDFIFKYPSQKDVDRIMSIRNIGNIETAKMIDFIETENVRMNVLIRGWSLEKPLSDMANLHPDCIRALRDKITKEIGSKGIY